MCKIQINQDLLLRQNLKKLLAHYGKSEPPYLMIDWLYVPRKCIQLGKKEGHRWSLSTGQSIAVIGLNKKDLLAYKVDNQLAVLQKRWPSFSPVSVSCRFSYPKAYYNAKILLKSKDRIKNFLDTMKKFETCIGLMNFHDWFMIKVCSHWQRSYAFAHWRIKDLLRILMIFKCFSAFLYLPFLGENCQ